MNIVYKFTSKVTGKWYIGSKTECKVVEGYILNRTGKKYFTSSKDPELIQEFIDGNMELEVLAEKVAREELLDLESEYQKNSNAVKDPMCYNMVLANQLDHSNCTYTRDCKVGKGIYNIYGQTLNEVANNTSVVSRKDNKAVSVGFPNYGTMVKLALEEIKNTGCSMKALDIKYKQNGFFKRALREIDLSMFEIPIPKSEIRKLMLNGATFLKACELVNVPDVAARHAFGAYFYKILNVEEKMSIVNGFEDRNELDNFIMREYLGGKAIKRISEGLDNISNSTVQRTIERVIRERLKVSDFE